MLGLLPEASAVGLAKVSVVVVAAVLQTGLASTTLVVNEMQKKTTTNHC